MIETQTTRVIFFPVKGGAAKLQILYQTIAAHFGRKEHILLTVEDENAQTFTQDSLWKITDTSFLPHVATDDPTTDFIAITKTKNNVNGAKIAFNLCSTPLLIQSPPFRIIYEFEDLSHPNKNRLSSLRFDAYKEAHFMIESAAQHN